MAFFDLSGQTAIVTGGAAGIGEAISRRLAAAGARVFIADRDAPAAASASKEISGSVGIDMNVTDAASVRRAVDHAIAETGRIDILVNNAGIAGVAAPLPEQTEDDWNRVIAVNMTGVFLCTRAVIPHMRERGYGRIVNIASIAGKEGNPNTAA
jgi:2-dehydro-3-deoxy-L-rhamnonate dehydrogenase (NAD+)